MIAAASPGTALYLKPLVALVEGWQLKAAASAVGVAVAELLGRVFEVRVDLLALVVLLVLADLATGLVRAWRLKEAVTSKRLRQTVIKTIEYTLFLGVVVAVGNVLGQHGTLPVVAPLLRALPEVAFTFVAATELRSIAENLTATGGAVASGPGRAARALVDYLRHRGIEAGVPAEVVHALVDNAADAASASAADDRLKEPAQRAALTTR